MKGYNKNKRIVLFFPLELVQNLNSNISFLMLNSNDSGDEFSFFWIKILELEKKESPCTLDWTVVWAPVTLDLFQNHS